VHVHRGNSSDVLNLFPNGYSDWVYIDGNHLYEYVAKDLELSFRKTRAGGLILGDDYTDGGWWRGDVKRAIGDFAMKHGIRYEVLGDQFIFRKETVIPA
jgi:hypothetical protein